MPQCKATNRANKPCRQNAIAGATVCRMHGGAAPQVKAKARERLLALIDPALATMARSLGRKYKTGEYPTAVELAAAKDILNRVKLGDGEDSNSSDGQTTWEEFIQIHRRKIGPDAATS